MRLMHRFAEFWPVHRAAFARRLAVWWQCGLIEVTLAGLLLLAGFALLPDRLPALPLFLFCASFAVLARRVLVALVSRLAAPAEVPAAELQSALKTLLSERKNLAEQIDDLAAIREVSLAINSILDFDEMIRAILELVTGSFEIDKALIYIQEDDLHLAVAGARSHGREVPLEKVLQKRIPLGATLVGRAARERRDLLEADAQRGAIAAVPLVAKDRLVGVLKLSAERVESLSPERMRRVRAVCGAIAGALENARLYREAVTDGLTGLFVHRHFQHRLEDEFQRARRYASPLALLLIDIDHFKQFNDTHGHQTGDCVLRGVARTLVDEARGTDLVARYGGEEMVILCPQTNLAGALNQAERVRSHIARERYRDASGEKELQVTVSIGVAVVNRGMRSRQELVERADTALYEAKHQGRNRVVSLDKDEGEAIA